MSLRPQSLTFLENTSYLIITLNIVIQMSIEHLQFLKNKHIEDLEDEGEEHIEENKIPLNLLPFSIDQKIEGLSL